VFVVELDVLDPQGSAPLRLVPQAVLERPLRVLLSEVNVYRLRVASLDKRDRRIRGDCPLVRSGQQVTIPDMTLKAPCDLPPVFGYTRRSKRFSPTARTGPAVTHFAPNPLSRRPEQNWPQDLGSQTEREGTSYGY
jgi:hypothetical protein